MVSDAVVYEGRRDGYGEGVKIHNREDLFCASVGYPLSRVRTSILSGVVYANHHNPADRALRVCR
jgi:hypothetical protein